MKAPAKISLDEIMTKRSASVGKTKEGDEALFKVAIRAPSSWDNEKRSAEFVMSTQAVDRYGDIVVTQGIDITNFNENPVVLFAHNSRYFPIGKWSNVQKVSTGRPPRLEGKCTFLPEGDLELADTAAKLVASGMLRACSIGFMPKEWESRRDEQERWIGVKFNASELLECSVCSVPAHPDALVKSAGGDRHLALQAIELVLEEWARTPDGLIVPREEYEKAYTSTRNKDVTIHEVRALEDEADAPAPASASPVINITINGGVDEKSLADRIKDVIAGIFKSDAPSETKVDPVVTVEDVEDEARSLSTEDESTADDTAEQDAMRQRELELRALALEAEMDEEIPAA